MSLILVVGMWTISREYLERPSPRWGVLAGLVLGGMVLVHGPELYTLALLLPVLLLGALRQVVWRDLPRDLGLAAVIALVCASVYVPSLLH
jgi:4-amino-4-deoxy-L-arabinose transferase-like glycosyltransferase